MEGFGLLLGHLVGDYIVQNDFLAANKTNPHPGKPPSLPWRFGPAPREGGGMSDEDQAKYEAYLLEGSAWIEKQTAYRLGHFACTVHCLLYTLSVWLFSCWWMPWWGLIACFAAHWPIDRFRLARLWMVHVSGQQAFATGPLSPWSVIVVDQCFHLLTLFVIALVARPPF